MTRTNRACRILGKPFFGSAGEGYGKGGRFERARIWVFKSAGKSSGQSNAIWVKAQVLALRVQTLWDAERNFQIRFKKWQHYKLRVLSGV